MQKRAIAHAGPTLWNTTPEALVQGDELHLVLYGFLFASSG